MSEIESEVLKSYQEALGKQEGLNPELVQALSEELAKETPNAVRLADILRLKKEHPSE